MTAMDERTPVVIGVGQVTDRNAEPETAKEPAVLAAEALQAAYEDAGDPGGLRARTAALTVINIVSWPYADQAAAVAKAAALEDAALVATPIGGETPLTSLETIAADISANGGGGRVFAVAGAEAYRTVQGAMKTKAWPPHWTAPDRSKQIRRGDLVTPLADKHRLSVPADVYPLYENAWRAARGLSFAAAQAASAELWSRYSKIAAANPYAWDPAPHSAEEIAAASPANRMISFPYTKLMNARIGVNQAAAFLVSDLATARAAGVAEDRMVFPLGGAGAREAKDILERPNYFQSEAMRLTLTGALEAAGLGAETLGPMELYSCFPIVPQMAQEVLGLGPDTDPSVTGGLTFFGGPGNNYVTHALAAMVERLRAGDAERAGLLYGQGEFVTKHYAMAFARTPRADAYPTDAAARNARRQAQVDAQSRPGVAETYEGEAEIETFTVHFSRDNQPEVGALVCRTPDGRARFPANTADGDADTLARLIAPETPIGLKGRVRPSEDGRNLFAIA